MTCPPIGGFIASFDTALPNGGNLIVTGYIMTFGGDVKPVLSVLDKQGPDPSLLWLDMKLEPTGSPPSDKAVKVPFRFEKSAEAGQYVAVEVFVEGTLCVATGVTQAQ